VSGHRSQPVGDRAAASDALLLAIQSGVPFAARPFAQLGEAVGLSEDAVLEKLRAWSESGVLREISAVLEGRVLGYDSALVVGAIPEARLDAVVEVVSAHPTVTHNYLREHHYNLWFTLAVPHAMGIKPTLELLAREAGVQNFHALRRSHVFKIGVNFDPRTLQNRSAPTAATSVEPVALDAGAVRQFRALQTPLSLGARPFEALAEGAGVSVQRLLAFGQRHLGGAIRRYVGTLRHRKLGVRENGIIVWRVPEVEIEVVGELLAQAPEVSHCYARNAIEGFPYRVYSMVHGPDRDSCHTVAARLAGETGIEDYAVLFSEREFKKVRLRYFLPELDAWWAARAGG
jgi:DNA-binding Lrp family transcriptional regulator